MDHSQLAEGLSTGSPPATWKEDPPTELSFRAMRLVYLVLAYFISKG